MMTARVNSVNINTSYNVTLLIMNVLDYVSISAPTTLEVSGHHIINMRN